MKFFNLIVIATITTLFVYSCNKPKTKTEVLNSLGLQQPDQPDSNYEKYRKYQQSGEISYSSNNTGQYVSVITFRGSGRRKSASFHLTGSDAKIVFKYKSTVSQLGVFDVYLVTKGSNAVGDGVGPELTSTQSSDSGESTIQRSEGDYYLDVIAAGKWVVQVQELR